MVCVSAEISHASVKFGHLHGFYGDSCGVWLQLLGLQQGRLGTQLPPSHGHPRVLRLKTGIILSFSAWLASFPRSLLKLWNWVICQWLWNVGLYFNFNLIFWGVLPSWYLGGLCITLGDLSQLGHRFNLGTQGCSAAWALHCQGFLRPPYRWLKAKVHLRMLRKACALPCTSSLASKHIYLKILQHMLLKCRK